MRKVLSLAHKVFLGLFPADLSKPLLPHQVLYSHSQPEDTGPARVWRTEEQLCRALGLRRACAVNTDNPESVFFADLRSVQNGISPLRTTGIKGNCPKPPVTQELST